MSVLKDLNTKTVNIDVLKGTTEKIVFNQHETTGTIRFQFKNGTDTFNLSAINSIRAYLLKPDNTKCFVDLEIENALAGTAIMNLTNNILAKPGKIICNLILKEGETDNKFTPKFAITCKDVEYDEEAIESSNEFSALEEALNNVSGGAGGTGINYLSDDEMDTLIDNVFNS